MINYSIIEPEGILVVKVDAALSKEDFAALSSAVNAYLADHTKLRGVLIHAKTFPGWQTFGGFGAHMDFIREHYKKVERVALVTDSSMVEVAELFAKYLSTVKVRHFEYAEETEAMDWLKRA